MDATEELQRLIDECGPAMVLSWAVTGRTASKRRLSSKNRAPRKQTSMAAVNRWLKEASDEEIEALKKLAFRLRSSF